MRLIVPLIAALSLASALSPTLAFARPGWTWTLYEDRASLALANEIPDTRNLAAVLECTPGSGLARVSIFPAGGSRTTPVVGRYQTTDAAFVAFVRSGKLSLKTEAGSGEIAMDAVHRNKLWRFSRLCGA
jgi:hypothetical protein